MTAVEQGAWARVAQMDGQGLTGYSRWLKAALGDEARDCLGVRDALVEDLGEVELLELEQFSGSLSSGFVTLG
jgi:hypothetical protein